MSLLCACCSNLFTLFYLLFGGFVFVLFYELFTYKPFRPAAKKSRALGNTKFDEKKLPDKIDALIIGSGQGGLSCGAVLAQYGLKVVVCEQHEVTGGGAHTFAVGGQSSKYKFNAGHHLSIPLHEYLLQLTCGSDIPPVPFSVLKDSDGANDRVVFGCKPDDETPLPIKDDVWVLEELCKRFPEQQKDIKKYFTLAESVQLRFALLIGSALLPQFLRGAFLMSPMMSIWRLWAGKTTADGLKEILPGDDEASRKLRSYAIGLWLDVGSPPARSSFFMQTAVFGGWQKVGVAYPKGSPQALSLAMCEAIESNGGRVFVSTPVVGIKFNTSGNKAIGIKLDNGKELLAPIVVSGLGYRVTEKLIEGSSRSVYVGDTEKSGKLSQPSQIGGGSSIPRPLQTKQGCGFIMANIGLKGKAKDLGITVANLWLQPACRANGWDALKGVDDYMDDPLGVPVENIPAGICFPSTKDGGSNLEENDTGYHTCQILVPANWSWFEEYAPLSMLAFAAVKPWAKHAPPHPERRNKEEYEALKQLWAARLLSLLCLHYPKIGATKETCIEFVNISTPLSIENYTRPGLGAAIGLDVTPQRFVDNEEFKELNHKHPRFQNLYRAGQDYLMTGQVLASASGLICALRILGFVATVRFVIRSIRLMLPRFIIPNYVSNAEDAIKNESKKKK